MAEAPAPAASNKHFALAFSYKFLAVALLVLVIGMFAIWRPWQFRPAANDRTVSVTGDATLRATPDEFIFSPSYDFTASDNKSALALLTAKSDEIVSHLKTLGVADSAIKTDSSGYNNGGGIYYPQTVQSDGQTTYTLTITVTLDSTKLLQKIQDYLVTTSPTAEVSPTATFSPTKQKSLENQARDQAEKNARAKADQSARNLGFKVAAVKSVEDGSLGGPIMYGANIASGVDSAGSKAPSLTVQPGQNDLNYTVSVVYYIR